MWQITIRVQNLKGCIIEATVLSMKEPFDLQLYSIHACRTARDEVSRQWYSVPGR